LKNVIERAMILSSSDELLPAHLPQEISGLVEGGRSQVRHDPWDLWLKAHPQGPVSLDEINGRIEQHFVRWALETTSHHRARAAELLGFSKVDQLRYLMRKHSID